MGLEEASRSLTELREQIPAIEAELDRVMNQVPVEVRPFVERFKNEVLTARQSAGSDVGWKENCRSWRASSTLSHIRQRWNTTSYLEPMQGVCVHRGCRSSSVGRDEQTAPRKRETRPGAGITCDVGSARNQKAPNR